MSESTTKVVILFLVALIGGLLFVYFIARGLSNSLSMLSTSIEKISRREYVFEIPNRSDEIGKLGEKLANLGRELRDTTISKTMLAHEVAARTEALQSKAMELEKANNRLRELDQLKSSLLTSVSHELRTPLTSVLGFARLIARDAQKVVTATNSPLKLDKLLSRIKGNEAIIHSESDRLTKLINAVLDLAKIESGVLSWNDEEVDLKAALLRVGDTIRGTREMYPHMDFELKADVEQARLFIDPDRFQQVMNNLVDNAFKFTGKGKVTIQSRIQGGEAIIMISDNGPGIPLEDRERIFERFHQRTADVLSDKPTGSGLGLTLCREIIQHYGGSIWVETNEDDGSCFVISLPVTESTAHSAHPGEPTRKGATA